VFFFSRDPYKKLKKQIGAHKVLDRKEDLMAYAVDASYTAPPGNHDPDLVILAETTDDVIAGVKYAKEANLPIVPRGTGTGMSSGAVPIGGGVVIVTEPMKQIIEVNVNQQWIQCQPGLTTADVKKAASKGRLFYPPDPSSYKISSIGGNVAENAGGLRCVKYGTTRDYVLGLKYVDPEGNLIGTGTLAEGEQPFDLTPLIVGSEGLFGIIVEIQLALIPKPIATRTIIAHFSTLDKAVGAIHLILPELVPSVLELMDDHVIEAIRQHDPYPFPVGTNAALLIETDGSTENADMEAQRVVEVLHQFDALEIHGAETEDERERLWELRRLISPSLARLATGKMNEDVVVPVGKIGRLINSVREIGEHYDVLMPIYGHAGDGNLHLNVMYDRTDPGKAAVAHDAVVECFKAVVEMGGTISGEHGIGASKNRYMGIQFSADEIQIFRSLKELLDPENRFNPHKVLPPRI
jgi:glycolate dehydrogenase FAD-linked subunit